MAPGAAALAGLARVLDPIESHVVRPARADLDLERLARRLSGRSVGIVLSGGGARAFSHIGVLEELTAAGVEIDRVAGVSMGAFIGGAVRDRAATRRRSTRSASTSGSSAGRWATTRCPATR